MGVYARAENIEVLCENDDVAKIVYEKIKEASERVGSNADENMRVSGLSFEDGVVYCNKESGRIQNLDFQMESLWNLIKDIDGIVEMSADQMVEGNNYYYTKEST